MVNAVLEICKLNVAPTISLGIFLVWGIDSDHSTYVFARILDRHARSLKTDRRQNYAFHKRHGFNPCYLIRCGCSSWIFLYINRPFFCGEDARIPGATKHKVISFLEDPAMNATQAGRRLVRTGFVATRHEIPIGRFS